MMNESHTHSQNSVNENVAGATPQAQLNDIHNVNDNYIAQLTVDEIEPPQVRIVQPNTITINFCEKSFTIDTSNKRNCCVINLSTRPLH